MLKIDLMTSQDIMDKTAMEEDNVEVETTEQKECTVNDIMKFMTAF